MGALIIDGKAKAASVDASVAAAVAGLQTGHGVTPGLAAVLVGDDPASAIYVASKVRRTLATGMNSFEHRLPADTSEADLLALIAQLNADPAVDGILVQLPLPKHLDADTIVRAINPAKDVDGLTPENAGLLVLGKAGLLPCTPQGSMMFVHDVLGPDLSGLEAVVIGRSILVGKPVALMLQNANATVTMAHSRTRDLPAVCRRADILVAAVGRPEMVRGDWIKDGAVVIDVGINRIPAPEKGEGKTRVVGDVATAEAAVRARAVTPVPGGVGLMTVACLLVNTVTAACRRRGLAVPKMG